MALQCHYFHSQYILPVNDEPITFCGMGSHVLIGTETSCIEQYKVIDTEPTYIAIGRSSSVTVVEQMAYCASGDFLVTVEKCKLDMNSSVRVYTNMQKASSQKPLRALVAGQLASLRLTSSDDSTDSVGRVVDGPSVIEIPLKDNPKCIAIENCTGNMAVSVTSSSGLCRLLIYGLFCKRIVQSNSTYSDVKCLLELQFAFDIIQMNISEEFIVCASRDECQLIQLKFEEAKKKQKSSSKAAFRSLRRSSASFTSQLNSLPDSSQNMQDKIIETISPIADLSAQTRVVASSRQPMVSVDLVSSVQTPTDSTHKPCAKAFTKIRLEDGELLSGPVKGNTAPCPVTVEFEGSCSNESGVLSNGVLSWMYRRLSRQSRSQYSSILLHPLYMITRDYSAEQKPGNKFVSSKRQRLSGLYCFIGTQKSGYLYSVLNGIHLLSTYSFVNFPVLQVAITSDRLFAMTSEHIDVYTCDCASHHAEQHAEDPDVKMKLRSTASPCHVGSNRFMGLQKMCHLNGYIAVLSKVSDSKMSENNWNIYVLGYPNTAAFHAEMVETAEMLEVTNPEMCRTLTLRAEQLLRATTYFPTSTSGDVSYASAPFTTTDESASPSFSDSLGRSDSPSESGRCGDTAQGTSAAVCLSRSPSRKITSETVATAATETTHNYDVTDDGNDLSHQLVSVHEPTTTRNDCRLNGDDAAAECSRRIHRVVESEPHVGESNSISTVDEEVERLHSAVVEAQYDRWSIGSGKNATSDDPLQPEVVVATDSELYELTAIRTVDVKDVLESADKTTERLSDETKVFEQDQDVNGLDKIVGYIVDNQIREELSHGRSTDEVGGRRESSICSDSTRTLDASVVESDHQRKWSTTANQLDNNGNCCDDGAVIDSTDDSFETGKSSCAGYCSSSTSVIVSAYGSALESSSDAVDASEDAQSNGEVSQHA